MKMIFATNNQNKVKEISSLVGDKFQILSLKDAGIDIDIPEPYDTIQENAWTKAKTIYDMTGLNCFSEDTGFFVSCLNGKPGVKAARYAGEHCSYMDNLNKLLLETKNQTDRRANFKTVVCLYMNGRPYYFEGNCAGHILTEMRPGTVFGYDPVFVPESYDITFSEMTLEEKNAISHRATAMKRMLNFINITI